MKPGVKMAELAWLLQVVISAVCAVCLFQHFQIHCCHIEQEICSQNLLNMGSPVSYVKLEIMPEPIDVLLVCPSVVACLLPVHRA